MDGAQIDVCKGDRRPLPALLNGAERAFVEEFDRRLADSPFCSLSLAHSRNILRHLGSEPIRASQVVQQCGVTKQAVSQQIIHLERNGYLVVEPDPLDGRARMLLLTEKGCQAQRLVAELFAEIERDWARRVGAENLAVLREVLTELVQGGPSCTT